MPTPRKVKLEALEIPGPGDEVFVQDIRFSIVGYGYTDEDLVRSFQRNIMGNIWSISEVGMKPFSKEHANKVSKYTPDFLIESYSKGVPVQKVYFSGKGEDGIYYEFEIEWRRTSECKVQRGSKKPMQSPSEALERELSEPGPNETVEEIRVRYGPARVVPVDPQNIGFEDTTDEWEMD